mmetsp:Transcript_5083/g.2862  ORF Transcript_5083/g.2862 Transcript_5083/m.2862 type:complete len:90 (-) Transcript_5083:157-426(-)
MLDVGDLVEREQTFGNNEKIVFPPKSFWSKFWEQIIEPIIVILIIVAIVVGLLATIEDPESGWIDAVGILTAVAIVCFVGAATEYAKEK